MVMVVMVMMVRMVRVPGVMPVAMMLFAHVFLECPMIVSVR